MNITEDQYRVLTDKINSVQESLNRIDKDLATDREEIGQFTIRLGSVEGQVDELRKGLKGLIEKVTNRFAQVIEPVITSADNLKDTIDKKKTIIVPEKRKSFWKFW